MQHGGNIAEASRHYGIAEGNWLDLSTGISPFAYPVGKIPKASWCNLPYGTEGLLAAASGYYGAPSDCLAIAPGSQALISFLPQLFAGEKEVEILTPTYSEHATSWQNSGFQIKDKAPILVVVNPNNPDGRVILPNDLLELAKNRKWLIVDEAFADVMPEISVASYVENYPNIIVLRSFGKFFGLAGLRLGVLIGAPSIVSKVREMLGLWVVSGPAIYVATKAFNDKAWIVKTRKKLRNCRIELDHILDNAGFKVIGGCDLFRLVETKNAAEWHEYMARNGVLVRKFDYNSSWLRLGLASVVEMQQCLSKALSKR